MNALLYRITQTDEAPEMDTEAQMKDARKGEMDVDDAPSTSKAGEETVEVAADKSADVEMVGVKQSRLKCSLHNAACPNAVEPQRTHRMIGTMGYGSP